MNIWFWVWVALAVVLCIAEVFTSGFFTLSFGIGAGIAAVLEFLWPGSISWQWASFILLSSALIVILRRLAERAARKRSPESAGRSTTPL